MRSIPKQPKPKKGFWARLADILTGGIGSPTLYMYEPVENDPLTYVTSDGLSITPDRFEFDGASIPRWFWWFPQLSPWDWPEGSAVHDWLFEAHHRGIDIVGIHQANSILGEACRTLGVGEWAIRRIVRACDYFGPYLWNREEPAAVGSERDIGPVVHVTLDAGKLPQ